MLVFNILGNNVLDVGVMRRDEFIKFCNSWMARDIDIALRYNLLNSGQRAKVEGMFFRQGLCHSNQSTPTGYFTDQYQRCARIKDCDRSLLYKAIESLSKKFADNQTYLIPISDYELAAIVCKINNPLLEITFHCELRSVQMGMKQVICIQTKFRNSSESSTHLILELLTFIAHWGILATQDTLIEILLDLGTIKYEQIHDAELASSIVEYNVRIDISKIFQLLRQAPRVALNLNKNDSKSYEFYCDYLETLIQGYCERIAARSRPLSFTDQRLSQQAYRRLYLKLLVMQDRDSDYKERMTALEFAFDEIVNLLSILKSYDKPALFYSIKKFISNNMRLSAREMPASVSLAGSCMQVIQRSIMSSMKYFAATHEKKDIRVYISNDLYYEVCMSYGIPQDFKHDQYVIFNGMQPKDIHDYDGEIVDLMLLHFHANVNRKHSGFAGHDVQAIIQNQFELRKMQPDSGQLIVVLDVALTNLSDVHIKNLLACFAKHIDEGKLAIILTTSLNKYCQNGFDRFPSGLGAIFYSKESFYNLSPGDELIGFGEYDVIPQTVAHCLLYSGSSVLTFYRMVHENSRYLHDNVVPESLYDDEKPIHIDSPYTNDGYRRPWGFLVVRFANEEIVREYRHKLQSFLDNVGFEYRNGFGFNSSTYAFIGANLDILRISIGPNASAQQYRQLVDFIVLQNENICRDKTNQAVLDITGTHLHSIRVS